MKQAPALNDRLVEPLEDPGLQPDSSAVGSSKVGHPRVEVDEVRPAILGAAKVEGWREHLHMCHAVSAQL